MKILSLFFMALIVITTHAVADDYIIDKKGQHAYIGFKISHLGYSWLYGRFNDFDGKFTYDKANPAATKIIVNINPASIDSNHAERDKHLRGKKFLYVKKFPKSTFVSTSFIQNGDGSAILTGDFTLRGVTKPITINVNYINEGKDPWGGYRIGFEGVTRLTLADFGVWPNAKPASREVEIILAIEGIRQ